MDGRWNLDVLYRGFDDPRFKEDFARLDSLADEFRALAADESVKDLELVHAFLNMSEEFALLGGRIGVYSGLRYEADTNDVEAQGVSGRLMAKQSEIAAADASLRRRVAAVDPELIKSDGSLDAYADLLDRLRKDCAHLLSPGEEEVFARMNISGAGAWEELRSALTSSATAEYRGQTLTLTQLRQLADDPDESVRRDACAAEIEACRSVEKPVAFALNSIKLQVINECAMRGFASPLEKTLYDSRMKRETLDAMLSAMAEYMPVFHRYLRAKAKLLGYEGGLRWYDLFAPVGKSGRKFSVDEAKEYLLGIFGEVNTGIRDLIKRAFENEWIDFFAREGKVGGAFDCGLPGLSESRVLTNFRGTTGDVVTLAHELGHAFHDLQVSGYTELLRGYTMPVAETASTFNENVVMSRAIADAEDDETKLGLIESQLCDACQIICDIYSRYLFETEVFERRAEEFLDPDTLCEIMTGAQKKAYGDGLDESTLNPYMWLSKSHYYIGSLSFYNFPYAFGGLLARGLYAKYLREGGAFFDAYKKMLRMTPVLDVEDAAAVAGIDLTDRAFWEEGLKSFAEEIGEFEKIAARTEKK